ncbi:FRG domain-containing protein [Methylogaea oryzae]|uniref:FRG domain-containing protein n=1 Tax=Methylogaea oryzae TaxID=1295382 RepID=UPI0006D13AA4
MGLDTTLSREYPKLNRLSDYYHLISKIKPEVEVFTNHIWPNIDVVAIERRLEAYDSLRLDFLPVCEYLIYLRHHGFPSPFLDWSRSLYVAAFFAFQKAEADRVAVFVSQVKVR